jgi:hypothetical protein
MGNDLQLKRYGYSARERVTKQIQMQNENKYQALDPEVLKGPDGRERGIRTDRSSALTRPAGDPTRDCLGYHLRPFSPRHFKRISNTINTLCVSLCTIFQCLCGLHVYILEAFSNNMATSSTTTTRWSWKRPFPPPSDL